MVNLTQHQKANLELILTNSGYQHKTKDRKVLFSRVDGGAVDELLLQSVINAFNPLPLAKADAITRIETQASEYLKTNTKQYPRHERELFHVLRQEVQSYDLDNNTPTPNVDIFAADRGVDRVDLINKIRIKINSNVQIKVLARSKRKQDLVKTSTDLGYINSINFKG